MKEEYQSLYDKITDPLVFRQDKDYVLPKTGSTLDFILWYRKETGNIEFTDGGKRFRVVSYPISTMKRIRIKEEVEKPELDLKIYPVKDQLKGPIRLGHCTRMDIVNSIREKYGMAPIDLVEKEENWEDEF